MIYEGEEKLKRQAENGFPKGITKICNRVYFALGYGGSTCTLVIGEESCILVDTLNGVAPAMEVRKEFEKLT
ncbi:MAG: alkyl/aryl-sulfatase, partial [Hungatella sp.]